MLQKLTSVTRGSSAYRGGLLVHLLAAVGVIASSLAGESYSKYSLWQRFPLHMLVLWATIAVSILCAFVFPKVASWFSLPLASGAHMAYALSAIVPIAIGMSAGHTFTTTEYLKAGALSGIHLALSLSASIWAVQASHNVILLFEDQGHVKKLLVKNPEGKRRSYE